MPLRCLVVEDQQILRQLLVAMLERHPALKIVGSAATAAEAIANCLSQRPDVLILDIALPDGDGLTVARALQVFQPRARVIVLSSFASTLEIPSELRNTIIAILDKSRAYQDLISTIETLLPEDERPVPEAIRLTDLTEREHNVLILLGMGFSNRAISKRLGISIRTVETHRRNISLKLGISGAALIHQATLLVQRML